MDSATAQLAAIHISSFDFDGCVLPKKSLASFADLADSNPTLIAALKAQHSQFRVNLVMIGSNRQDARIDDVNRQEQYPEGLTTRASCPYSAFSMIERLADKSKAEFDPLLLADVYSQQEHGAAHHLAMREEKAVHHTRYVFDEYKLSLLYMQIHQAALNARSCDFIVVNDEDEAFNPRSIAKRSNAAYIYNEHSSTLYYVNSFTHTCEEVPITDASPLASLIGESRAHDVIQRRQCFRRPLGDTGILGFTLDADALTQITEATNNAPQHPVTDHPIVFEYYDDRQDILNTLTFYFRQHPHLLPKNVVLRLHRYDEHSRVLLHDVHACLAGSGNINPDPGQSLREVAVRAVRFTPSSPSNYNYDPKDSKYPEKTSATFQSPHTTQALAKAATIEPTVVVDETLHTSGLIQEHSPTKTLTALVHYKENLASGKQEKATWAFDKTQEKFSTCEQIAALDAVIRNYEDESEKISPEHLPVLARGKLAELLERHKICIDENRTLQTPCRFRKVLLNYKRERQLQTARQYTNFFRFGVSKQDKFAAVSALYDSISRAQAPNQEEQSQTIEVTNLSRCYKRALSSGKLKKRLEAAGIKLSYKPAPPGRVKRAMQRVKARFDRAPAAA